jgi:hypothetical protein
MCGKNGRYKKYTLIFLTKFEVKVTLEEMKAVMGKRL